MAEPRLFVEAPPRRPARGGLFAAIGSENLIDVEARVAMGVQWIPDGCSMPVVAPGLCWQEITPPQGDDGEGGLVDLPKSDSYEDIPTDQSIAPFALFAGVECYLNGDDDNDFEARARRLLLGGEGWAVESIFHTEVLSTLTADAISPATLGDAALLAEVRLGNAYPGLGMIHAPRDVTGHLLVDHAKVDDDWLATTKQGVPIANGSGYPADMLDGNTELYYTGQVTVWRGPIVVNRVVDPTSNRALAIAERVYAIGYDCVGGRIAVTPA